MTRPLVVVGCGGYGREVLDVVHAVNDTLPAHDRWDLLGVVDDAPAEVNLKRLARLDVPFLGAVDELARLPRDASYVAGIGDPRARRTVVRRIDHLGMVGAQLVHPSATVGSDTELGEGVVVCAGVRVTTNVTLGRHVHLNQIVSVGHDSTLDDFVMVNPLAAVSGDCHLAEAVLIGTCAAVLQGRRVGAEATVGASACVVRDVPPRVVVKGVPAR